MHRTNIMYCVGRNICAEIMQLQLPLERKQQNYGVRRTHIAISGLINPPLMLSLQSAAQGYGHRNRCYPMRCWAGENFNLTVYNTPCNIFGFTHIIWDCCVIYDVITFAGLRRTLRLYYNQYKREIGLTLESKDCKCKQGSNAIGYRLMFIWTHIQFKCYQRTDPCLFEHIQF